MDKNLIATTLKNLKENSPKRNFRQSIDLIINLKGLDLKKPEHQVNMFVTLHYDTGKKVSVCALVGPELLKSAKEVCDEIIPVEQFDKFKGKKEIKKLANKYDYFISQANIMSKVATVFGRYLGPRGKMPNPKIGAILPPNGNVKPLYERLKKTVVLATKNESIIKCIVGKEDSKDEEIVDNILTIYNSLIQKLPNEIHNIKSVMIKQTMSPAFKIGEEKKEEKEKTKRKIIPKVSAEVKKQESKEEKESEQKKKETKEKQQKTAQKKETPKEKQ